MHQKHPKLARPRLGYYARTEFALVGSTCARMETVMDRWRTALEDRYRCLCVTGEHREQEVATRQRFDRKTFTCGPARWNGFDDRLLGGQFDLALVNGNHYPAVRQIVFVDAAKAGTLERRREQLTDVAAVVLVDGEVPEWLREVIGRQGKAPTLIEIDRVDALLPLVERAAREAIPPLRALLLAGGKSQRMGRDKAQLVYRNGQTEVERLRVACEGLGLSVNLSVRAVGEGSDVGKASDVGEGGSNRDLPVIEDRFLGLGPAGAICSAFLIDPDAAWLVLACDLPLLDAETLSTLIEARRTDRVATAVRGPQKEWPEPLVAIYEPRAYQRLLQFVGLGYSCPRKLLINSAVEVVELTDGRPLTNANTPEERQWVLGQLSGSDR